MRLVRSFEGSDGGREYRVGDVIEINRGNHKGKILPVVKVTDKSVVIEHCVYNQVVESMIRKTSIKRVLSEEEEDEWRAAQRQVCQERRHRSVRTRENELNEDAGSASNIIQGLLKRMNKMELIGLQVMLEEELFQRYDGKVEF